MFFNYFREVLIVNQEVSIVVNNVGKIYNLYEKASDRLREIIPFSRKTYHKEYSALEGVSFEVKAGETFGIIGSNGAGKSTLLKLITGVAKPTGGSIQVLGKVSALLELGAGFNMDYTGIQNIYLNGTMMGYKRCEMEPKVKQVMAFADIGDFIYQPVKTYSSGMFARLAFAVAINVEPDILIVDEALSVGDVFFQNKCYRKFEELREKGTTVIFVSHDIASVKQMCTRVLWLDQGRQKMLGESVEVCNAYSNSIKDKGFFVNKEATAMYQRKDIRKIYYPPLSYSKESLLNDSVIIKCAFFKDLQDSIVTELECGKTYTFVQVFESHRRIEKCISGFVMETPKGLWVINCNSSIYGKKTPFSVSASSITCVEFTFTLPHILKGNYIVGTAVSEGEIENFTVLTWLYQVMNITIINQWANSAVIDIDPKIEILTVNESEK